MEAIKPFLEMDTPPDFIFFDLAGTIDNLGVINTIVTMDYIFCPITADNVVLKSSIMFASQLNDSFISIGKTQHQGTVYAMEHGRCTREDRSV